MGNWNERLSRPSSDALSGFAGASVEEVTVSRECLVPSTSGGGSFLSMNGLVIILTFICCCDAIWCIFLLIAWSKKGALLL